MSKTTLSDALNECIDMLASGASVNDCLSRYPNFASSLRPMLEAGLLTQRASLPDAEVEAAKERVRFRVAAAANEAKPAGANRRRWVPLVASVLIAVFGVAAGTAVAAESSLPGDTLYPYKRFTESVRLVFGRDGTLEAQFERRRTDEVRQLLTLEREAEVQFEGVVETVDQSLWTVNGIRVEIGAETVIRDPIRVGDEVMVRGQTAGGDHVNALEIGLIERGLPPSTVTPTASPSTAPSLTPAPTESPTVSPPAPTASPAPSSTVTMPPASETPTDSVTPRPSATTSSPTVIATGPSIFTEQEQPTSGSTSTCGATVPSGWVMYNVRGGDTLSGLAATTGVSVNDLMTVNCIANPSLLVIGQALYLPFIPPTQAPVQEAPSGGAVPAASPGDSIPNPETGGDNDNDDGDSGLSSGNDDNDDDEDSGNDDDDGDSGNDDNSDDDDG